MPYSGNAVLTEYFRIMKLPDGSTWIRLTQLVEDMEYLAPPYIVNYQFKKLPDGSLPPRFSAISAVYVICVVGRNFWLPPVWSP